MKRYFNLNNNTYNNYCDNIDVSYMVEIPDDNKPYGFINNIVSNISQTDDYINEQKKQSILQAKSTRDKIIDAVTSSVLIDQLQLSANIITQEVYNTRFSAKSALYSNAITQFYSTTNLIPVSTITE